MPQYEVKSGKTVFFVNAEDRLDAVRRFRQSCGIMSIDSVTYVNDGKILDSVISNFEKEKESYFDVITFDRS